MQVLIYEGKKKDFVFCLCTGIFRVTEVQLLATSLKQLWQTSRSSLVDLSVAVLPQTALMEQLLDACPGLHSLSLEIHPLEVDPGPCGTGTTYEPTDLQGDPGRNNLFSGLA